MGEGNNMRFEKNKEFVEIASARSTNFEAAVWHIESSRNLTDLPVEFRAQVQKTDKEGYESLKHAVCSWAACNGYELVSGDAADQP